jgi:glucose/arabinose dehydrogenase
MSVEQTTKHRWKLTLGAPLQRWRVRLVVAFVLLLGALVPLLTIESAASLPANFIDSAVISNLTQPTNVEFATDGQVFIAEKAGVVKRYASLQDPTPEIVIDISVGVANTWDRGLLGMALDPAFLSGRPYLYVLYAYDALPGGVAPKWNDYCPDPPGLTNKGCVVTGRLSRFTISPTPGAAVAPSAEKVLIQDWCQQYPSHSVGDLAFAQDGSLLVTAGDGASFTFTDYGQDGSPVNPCGDPVGDGGAFRSQDVRTPADPTSLDGSLLRVNPDTGFGVPSNPKAGGADINAARIVATGLRNPFRMGVRPGANEVWIGDVGWGGFEEVNRLSLGATTGSSITNFGWPCFEGSAPQANYAALSAPTCLALPAAETTNPHWAYGRGAPLGPDDRCLRGSQSISGVTFRASGTYPAKYNGAAFIADYSRECVVAMLPGPDGVPSPSKIEHFVIGAKPVDLAVGPGGDLFYLDIQGALHRVTFAGGNENPTAVIQASTMSGPAPLTVSLDARATIDPTPNDILRFEWDLDDDSQYDDATTPTTAVTLPNVGNRIVRVRATDSYGASSIASVRLTATSASPKVKIDSPLATSNWKVGDTITFSGSVTEPNGAAAPASSYEWKLSIDHCETVTQCHVHQIQTFSGIATGSFVAPDHGYPSFLELTLTGKSAAGVTASTSVRLSPRTALLLLRSQPSGVSLTAGEKTVVTPSDQTVIAGSRQDVVAPLSALLPGGAQEFASWSDGGARAHPVTVSTDTTLTATFQPTASAVTYDLWRGRSGDTLASIPVGTAPTETMSLTEFRTPTSVADNFGGRLRSLVTPTVSGAYTFWIESDDHSSLLLSSNADPANRRKIAGVTGWTNPGEYDKYPEQRSASIALTAGQSYFLEAFVKEGTGVDNLSVAWQGPGQTTKTVIPGSVLKATLAGCSGWCPDALPFVPDGGSGATMDTWNGVAGSNLTDIPLGTAPAATSTLSNFAVPANRGDNLGTRVRALLTAPATGSYSFWVASDDRGVLFLSTNATATQRVEIASVPSWVNPGEFDKHPQQRSAVIQLVAGQQYFIEAFAKESNGGDHLSVAWQAPGMAAREVLTNAVLSPTTLGCAGWCPSGVGSDPTGPGGFRMDTFAGRPGWNIGDVPTDVAPTSSVEIKGALRTPPNRGDDLGTRVRALLTPTATGTYTFWFSSDDRGVLLLSTDANPANRRRIAGVDSYSSPDSFDQFPEQRSVDIQLLAGVQYFIEAFAKEGGGGDHLSVAWQGPGITRQVIPASVIAPTETGCSGWCPSVKQVVTKAGVSYDFWANRPGWELTDIPVGTPPTKSESLGEFATAVDQGDNFASRSRALLTAPVTGSYTFWLSSDDRSELNLSTSADTTLRRVIAYMDGWSAPNDFTKYPSQKSVAINLVAGQKYFIEVFHKEGGGGDHVNVAWTKPGGTREIIPASALEPTSTGCAGWCPLPLPR